MRVCHKCGAIDPAEWKHTRFSYYIDYCTYENFVKLHSNLAKNLDGFGKQTDDLNYIYYRTKTGRFVLRKAKIDVGLKLQAWNDGCEKAESGWVQGTSKLPDKHNLRDYAKHWDKFDPSQTKLLEKKKLGEACVAGDNKP